MVPVRLLSNTLSCRPLDAAFRVFDRALSDGGSVPVSALRLKSRNVRPVYEVPSVVRLLSTDGTDPFRPRPTGAIALTPPITPL